MKTLIFSLIILLSSVCYGQVPITKDRVLVLVSQRTPNSLSQSAEQYFTEPAVRKFMGDKGIQFVLLYGEDASLEWRAANKITHYPAVVYYMKQDGEFKLARTISGTKASVALGNQTQVRNLLGMKAETYREAPPRSVPSNNPLIPGQPPVQYVSPPQQYVQPPQQFMNQWGSAPPSS